MAIKNGEALMAMANVFWNPTQRGFSPSFVSASHQQNQMHPNSCYVCPFTFVVRNDQSVRSSDTSC